MARIVVGLSGGVDSSVAALLLKEQGHEVIGLFMLNWEENDVNGRCSAQQDFEDVKRVAEAIGIPYFTVNYAEEYKDRVFSYFLREYSSGRTPNPDVLCNREIKFGPFLEKAMQLGADYIATGHYAKVVEKDGIFHLYKSKDLNKDQTYFLNQLNQFQLSKTIFPLADIEKPEVRRIAQKNNLVTAKKKDSTGICFIGERDFRQFLKNYIPAKKGEILDLSGNRVGGHDGAMYYTIGQRRGLNIGGKSGYDDDRWFVVKKDVGKNILYVNCGECDELYSNAIIADEFNWINKPKDMQFEAFVKARYRQPDQKAAIEILMDGKVKITFDKRQRAINEGQFAVVYTSEGECLGGGKIIQII